MVDGVNNSLANSETYQYHYAQYLKMKKAYGGDLSFQAYLSLQCAGSEYAMQRMENYVETGNANKGDGINGNTLNNHRTVYSATDKNGQMYQTSDQEGYYEVDWDTGNMNYTTDKNKAAQMLGLDTDNVDFDTIVFGAGTAQITDFVFSGLDDGQQREEYDLKGMYKNIEYAVQEFDPCYLVDSSLQNMSDPEYQKAIKNWEYLQSTITQWISQSELDALSEMDPSSSEYKQALIDIILDKLDQTNSFTDHDHLKPDSGALEENGSSNGTDGSGNTDGTNQTGKPSYDPNDVLVAAGLDSVVGETKGPNHYGKKSEHLKTSKSDAVAQAGVYLDQYVSALVKELGSQYTDEIKSYINKAKVTVLNNSDAITTGFNGGGIFKEDKSWGIVKMPDLINDFTAEFDRLCETRGKSEQEVAAEEEKNNKLQNDYKTFYNFNIKSSSLGVSGVKSEYTIPMINGNYKEEAQNKVLTPYASKIISSVKDKCSNLSESQIKSIVNKAMEGALNDDSWLTATGNISNGGTYSIDTDKLLDSFAENIKTQIKKAGYTP